MAKVTYHLSQFQKEWLLQMIEHKDWEMWLSVIRNERIKIRNILYAGYYDEKERTFLNELVKYYKDNIHYKGTLKNPKP